MFTTSSSWFDQYSSSEGQEIGPFFNAIRFHHNILNNVRKESSTRGSCRFRDSLYEKTGQDRVRETRRNAERTTTIIVIIININIDNNILSCCPTVSIMLSITILLLLLLFIY